MFKKIVIIGLGLMGGSLAAACRKKFPHARIVGITRNRAALALAKKKKWIHEGVHQLGVNIRDAEAIILCTPVNTYLPLLKKIDRFCKPHALVMDVGSVKGLVVKQAGGRKWKRLSFVGCHPMVGSHRRGPEAACPCLYDNGLVLLTKDPKTCSKSLKKARQFWMRFSRRIVQLSPELHDKLVGEVSHLPHAIAVCLMHTISDPALKLASTGFRDTTRIAASDPSVWQPIFRANKHDVIKALARFEKTLKSFKKALQSSSPSSLIQFLKTAQQKRQAL